MSAAWRLLLGALVLALWGCGMVDDPSRVLCTSDAQCPPDGWYCLGNASVPSFCAPVDGSVDDDDSAVDDDDSGVDDDDSGVDDDDLVDDDDDDTVDDDDSAPDDDDTVDDDDTSDDDDSTPDDDDLIDDDDVHADVDGDGVPASADCDDLDPLNFPGNLEVCDGQDNDCSGWPSFPGEGIDADGDGSLACADCDESDAARYPGNPEVCDGWDNDCDGSTWALGGEVDDDGDGSLSCVDCDDGDALRSPDLGEDTAPGTCADGIDNDCDGAVDSDDPGCPTCLSATTVQGIDLVHVCAGTFEMGCTTGQSNCEGDELPAHPVTLTHDFELGGYEVTQGEWQGLMGNNPSSFASCGADCPVEEVNWWESLAFANAMSSAEGLAECYTLSGCSGTAGVDLYCSGVTITAPAGNIYDCEGYRLPTEAEWEYAARGGEDLLYSGSDTLSAVGWYGGNTTHPGGQLQANAFGLSDMTGNVFEWTQDWWGSNYYSGSIDTDPPGPSTGSSRVFRGGSWYDSADYCRAALRLSYLPGNRIVYIGFRLARSIP